MGDNIDDRERSNACHKRKFRLASKCEAVAYQRMEVGTPIKIEVASRTRCVRIECCKPIICDYSEPECHRRSSCEFVVKQFIDVRIPICYHVKTNVGESFVKCKDKHGC